MLRQHTIWACYPSAKCKPQLISVVSTFDFPGLLNNLNFSTLMFKRLKKIRKSELSQIKMFSPERNTIEQILIDNQHHSAKKTKKKCWCSLKVAKFAIGFAVFEVGNCDQTNIYSSNHDLRGMNPVVERKDYYIKQTTQKHAGLISKNT